MLFSVQVKSTTTKTITVKATGESGLNRLDKYTLSGASSVEPSIANVWRGLGFPCFLVYVIEDEDHKLSCYYKRCSHLIDGHSNEDDKSASKAFYKVNDEASFLAFANAADKSFGFARDLLIDHVRIQYSRGHLILVSDNTLGCWPFPSSMPVETVFSQVIDWHRSAIDKTLERTRQLLWSHDQHASAND